MTDDEIDEMFHEQYGEREGRQGMAAGAGSVASGGGIASPQMPSPQVPSGMGDSASGLPIYPLALAQTPQLATTSGQGLLTRQLGPLPVWGWGLAALGVGVGGYFLWQNQGKVSKNDGDDGDDDQSARPTLPSGNEERGGWRTSRGDFAQHLNRHFMRKGLGDKVHVFDNAEDAQKKLKVVSPLVNLTCKVPYKVDKDLERLCKREGLQPIAHEDGSVGFYPAKSKRGKQWEEYIDLLRDDGQKI